MSYKEQLDNYIKEHCIKTAVPEEFDMDYDLIESGILDSLAIMNLVTHIESTYGIEFGEQDISPENFTSITLLSEFINRKKS